MQPCKWSYGTFGYNLYLGSTLITFTDKTSYTYKIKSGENPYGTYKVIATYKSYSGVQSDAATYTLKEKAKPTPTPTPSPSPSDDPTPSPTPSPDESVTG